MAVSHENCTHPRTPAGRRACRNTSARADTAKVNQGLTIRTKVPARIQPRRSGARVSNTNSSCVQATLHTRGRCACGWENWAAA